MLPNEIIIEILSYSCVTSEDFYNYSLLSYDIYKRLRHKEIVKRINFSVNQKTIYFLKDNIETINKSKWIQKIFFEYKTLMCGCANV